MLQYWTVESTREVRWRPGIQTRLDGTWCSYPDLAWLCAPFARPSRVILSESMALPQGGSFETKSPRGVCIAYFVRLCCD